MEKQTIIVNLFAGPGAGKSTGAAYIFSKLKMVGVDAEYVSEFAKDKVWENNSEVFKCQFYVTGKQAFKISRCYGKVDVIVTDSPILLGAAYADNEALKAACEYEFCKYRDRNENILLKRVKAYNPNGRHQSEDEAKEIDKQMKDLLEETLTPYREFPGNQAGYDAIVELILRRLGNQ